MISEKACLSDNIYIGDVVVVSGLRPAGRTVDMQKNGRSSHGFLYIWSGEADFERGEDTAVKVFGGQLLYIPKELKYKMQYTGENTTFVLVNFNL